MNCYWEPALRRRHLRGLRMIRSKIKAVCLPRQLLSLSTQIAMLVVVALSMAFAAVAQALPSSPTDSRRSRTVWAISELGE